MGSSIGGDRRRVYPPMGDGVPTKVGAGADLGRLLLSRVRA
jgi:hypothetical protein